MEDVRDLKELQLDALREVANIGAGHAATALSQMTNRTIMIAVPEVNVRALEDVTDLVGSPDTVIAAVMMHMMGDLTGRTLVLFPEGSARTLCDILLRRQGGTTGEFGAMEQSGIKEAGNILASAYLNALSDFMGMMLVPSVPSLVVDLSAAVLTSAYLNFGHERDFVFCVDTSFRVEGTDAPARATSCSCPTCRRSGPSSTPFACPNPMPAPVLSERDLAVLRSFAGRIDPSDAGAHNNLGVLYYQKGLVEEAIAEFVKALELDPRDAGGPGQPGDRLPGERPLRSPDHRAARAGPAPARGPRGPLGAGPRLTPRSGAASEAIAEFEALLAWHPARRARDAPARPGREGAWRARLGERLAGARLRRGPAQRRRPVLRRRGATTTGDSTTPRSARCARRSRTIPTTPKRTTCSPSSTATWASTRRRGSPPSAPSRSIPTLAKAQANLALERFSDGGRPEEAPRGGAARSPAPSPGAPSARSPSPARHSRTSTSVSRSGRRATTRRPCASTTSRSRRARTAGSISRRWPRCTSSAASWARPSSCTRG